MPMEVPTSADQILIYFIGKTDFPIVVLFYNDSKFNVSQNLQTYLSQFSNSRHGLGKFCCVLMVVFVAIE